MFPIQVETKTSEDDIAPEEEEEEEEAEEQPDELTISVNQEIAECFALFDKTKSNIFEIKYLEKALKCLGIFLSSFELEELTETMDKNGLVLFEEFRTYAFEKIMETDPLDSLKAAFGVFDPDNEGMLPTDRFKRWMTTLGDPLTEKEAKELAKLGDPGNKGFVVYDDLVGLLLAK